MFNANSMIVHLLVAVITFAVGANPAAAAGDADSRQEIAVHPRLLFSADEMKSWQAAGRLGQEFIWDADDGYFDNCAGSFGTGEPWNIGDGWQRWGWWWGTTAAFLHAKTGEQKYANSSIELMMAMCRSEHWELGGEQDYGMGAANIMATVAIIYDICYDKLTQEQRDIVRRRLLLAARRFYEYGFNEIRKLEKPAVRYWQSDPQNNHRWHRVCGYLLGTMVIANEIEGVDFYLQDAIRQTKFLLEWLPQDGTCHESVGYQAFGTQFLVPTVFALDRNTGSSHLTTNRAFREFPHFRAHMVTPDRRHVWSFGDGGESTYYFSHYNFKLASAWGDGFMQAAHLKNFAASPGSYGYHGFSLIWHDPDLKPADLSKYPTWRFFPDMGIATFRASWEDPGALAGFFKCGPYGGHRLNEFRYSRKPPIYVNVAHDHPDANSFLVSFDGKLMAQDYGTHARLASEHNTIMVNGKSQAGSGSSWTQPIDNMADSARVEQYFGSPGYGMVRGEAGNFYEDLSRYARTLVYVDDSYMLVADDIRSPKPADIEWYYNTTADITAVSAGSEQPKHQWRISRGDSAMTLSMVGPDNLVWSVVDTERTEGRNRKRGGIRAKAADQRRCLSLMLLGPAERAGDVEIEAAGLVDSRLDDLDIMAEVQRGDLRDLIVVSANLSVARWKGLETDAHCAVVTLDKDAPKTVMIAGGSFLRMGDFSLSFSRKACAKLDITSGELLVNSPLGCPADQVEVTVCDAEIKLVNGTQVSPGGDGQYQIQMPTWQQRQDAEDGFDDLPVVRAARP